MTEVQIDCKDSGVPNQPKTPNTVVRLAPELRDPLQREADERGVYLSDVIREACQEHIERRDRPWIAIPEAGWYRVEMGPDGTRVERIEEPGHE